MDFDIDAVSLVTYDIDNNGLILTWSPYSNLNSKDLLDASMRLPVPTGQETEFKMIDDIRECGKFFTKYYKLFTPDSILSKNSRNQEIDTVEKFELLRQLLLEPYIPKPNDSVSLILGLLQSGLMKTLPKSVDLVIEDIYNGLKEFIDKHNLYFDLLNDYDLSRVVNNITMYSLYLSIIDPIDLLQSMESVDGPTEPIKHIANTKSVAANKAKVRNPGNWMNKIESILENQEGKDCIAISAVGIKGFFALTLYFNEVLNSGDSKKQEYLINVSRKLLANIRAINPDTIINLNVVDILIEQGFLEDQAVVLSALLGLSADNAKELALAKLNAGSKTIGIYLYSISTGIDFETISNLMMSPTGLIVRSILDDDIFQDINGYFKLIDSFGYFEYGPTRHLSKYDKHINPDGNTITSPLQVLNKELNQYVDKKNKKTPLLAYFDHCKANGISLSEQFEYLNSLKNNYKGSGYGKTLYLQLLDFAKSYLLLLNDINWKAFNLIKYLAKGADEMRLLGAIAGLNQGIPTDLKGILGKCELIENIFDNDDYSNEFKSKVIEELGNIYIDLNKFAFDSKYRLKCIDLYNEIKHTFNVLDCVSTLDHLLGYIQTLATDKSQQMRSYKFRGIANNYKEIMKEYNCTKDEAISGIERYIGDKLLSDFLHSIEIELPKGTKVYGQDTELQVNTTIRLGDEKANTTFRIWMENEVIPNLKKGIGNPRVANNKFIKDLSGGSRNNTVSGNSSIIYTIPINMLPRTENERSIFNQYLDSFNELSLELYNPENLSKPVSIIDLFILYSMIAHDWKLSENSLVPILENQMNRGIIKEFHSYESFLDKSNRNVELEVYFRENIIPYIASKKGPYGSTAEYVWGINPDTENKELMKKLTDKELNDRIEEIYELSDGENISLKLFGIIGKYEFIGTTLDPNYFTRGDIKTDNEIFFHKIKIEGKFYTIQINWTRGSKKDSIVLISKEDADFSEINKQLSELKELPTKVSNGVELLDIELIKDIIKQKLNCK